MYREVYKLIIILYKIPIYSNYKLKNENSSNNQMEDFMKMAYLKKIEENKFN